MSKKSFFSGKKMQYIEAVVYIFAIIIVIFASVYGSIYIRMMPLLLVMGGIGRLIFNRPVVTTIFGMLVSVCIVHLNNQPSIFENLIISGVFAIDIAIGEMLGDYLRRSYEIYKTEKKKLTRVMKKTYLYTVLLLIVGLVINDYTTGNLISYNKCKNKLYSYLEETYLDIENFKLEGASYSFGKNRNYTFRVKNIEGDYTSKFIIYLKNTNIVKDEYKETKIAKNNNDINIKLHDFIKEKNMDAKYSGVNMVAKYNEQQKIEIQFIKQVQELSQNEKETFAKKVVEFLEDIKQFEEYSNVEQLFLNIYSGKDQKETISSNIYIKAYEENKVDEPYEYILKSLSLEFTEI